MIDPMKDMCGALDLLREITTPAMLHLTALKDHAIAQALQSVQPVWTKEEIGRRCVFLRTLGSEVETLHVDGIPVIVFYPGETVQEWKQDRLIVTHTQKFSRVQAVSLKAANS